MREEISRQFTILDFQSISWDKPDNVARPRWFGAHNRNITYSFVLNHIACQEYQKVKFQMKIAKIKLSCCTAQLSGCGHTRAFIISWSA